MTRIILVRHGHVDWIIPERFRGRAELALSAVGQAQEKATARLIAASWQLDALYTSPLGRARETAAAVAEPFGIEPQAVEALSDIDYGDWQGLTREAAVERWPQEVALWFRAPHLARIPGGETLAAVLSRTSAALHDILLRHPSDAVAILGHDSVNRVMLL